MVPRINQEVKGQKLLLKSVNPTCSYLLTVSKIVKKGRNPTSAKHRYNAMSQGSWLLRVVLKNLEYSGHLKLECKIYILGAVPTRFQNVTTLTLTYVGYINIYIHPIHEHQDRNPQYVERWSVEQVHASFQEPEFCFTPRGLIRPRPQNARNCLWPGPSLRCVLYVFPAQLTKDWMGNNVW